MKREKTEFIVVEDSRSVDLNIGSGGSLVRRTVLLLSGTGSQEVHVRAGLMVPGADLDLGILVLASGSRKVRVSTVQDHAARDTRSNLLVKSVIAGKGSVTFEGLIRIAPEGHRSDAYQRSESLLLTEHAQSHSVPKLEILANDVRCTHGSVTKPLSEEELWYLRTRGIPPAEAARLMVSGFMETLLEHVSGREKRVVREKAEKVCMPDGE